MEYRIYHQQSCGYLSSVPVYTVQIDACRRPNTAELSVFEGDSNFFVFFMWFCTKYVDVTAALNMKNKPFQR